MNMAATATTTSTELAVVAQYLCLAVYCSGSIAGVAYAISTRKRLRNINKPKEILAATGGDADKLPASFSRTVGLIGTMFLCAFMWCMGLLILAGSPLIGSVGFPDTVQKYVLACSALFAPYAFNQLAQVFPQQVTPSPSENNMTRQIDPAPPPVGIPK